MALITETDEKHPQPSGIIRPLYNHQLAGLYQIQQREKDSSCEIPYGALRKYQGIMKTRCGFLCDPLGSGKTLVALSLVLLDSPPEIEKRRTIHSRHIGKVDVKNYSDNTRYERTNVFVVPHGLMYHWKEHAIKYFTEDISKKIVFLVKRKQVDEFNEKYIDTCTDFPHIVICSSTRWRTWGNVLLERGIMVDRIVYDNADKLKIPQNPCVLSRFYWFITSSPETWNMRTSGFLRQLIYDLTILCMDCRMFDKNRRVQYGNMFIQSCDSFVKTSLKLPDVKEITMYCKLDSKSSIFGSALPYNLRKALEAGDMNFVLQHLGCDTEQEIFSTLTKNITDAIGRNNREIENYKQLKYDTGPLMEENTRLTERMGYLKERISDTTCAICIDEIQNTKSVLSCCSNTFCLRCILRSTEKTRKCPMCRTNTTVDEIRIVSDKYEDTKVRQIPTRWEVLERLMTEKDEKTIIFSNFGFSKVNQILEQKSIRHAELKGTYHQIKRVCNEYMYGDLNCLLLCTKYKGSGHHFPQTSRIVFLHEVSRPLRDLIINTGQRVHGSSSLEVYTMSTSIEKNDSLL